MAKNARRIGPARTSMDATQETIAAALAGCELDPQLSYADQLADALRIAIIQGRLLPGTALSEATISAAVGVSRTPVREALRALSARKLVDVFPQAGTQVALIRLSLIKEGRFIRSALEAENAITLASNLTGVQLETIKNHMALQRRAMEETDGPAFIAADDAMHRYFFEATGRARIWPIVQDAKVHIDRVRYLLFVRHEEYIRKAYLEHEDILAKLEARDAPGLAAEMHRHLDAVILDMLALEEQGRSPFFAD